MAGGIDWFRWHHGTVNDQKFPLVARRAGASVAEVIAVWANLLERASQGDERGNLGSMPDFEAMDCAMGMEEGRSARIFAAMQSRDLVDDALTLEAWARRQPKKEDDGAAERKRQQREREAAERAAAAARDEAANAGTERDNSTSHGASRDVTLEKRREEKNSPSLRSGEARASRLPADWVLPPDWQTWAEQTRPDLDIGVVASQFLDYWVAKPGKDGRKLDWQATWRNWVRGQRAIRATGPPGRATQPSKQSDLESRNAATAARLSERFSEAN